MAGRSRQSEGDDFSEDRSPAPNKRARKESAVARGAREAKEKEKEEVARKKIHDREVRAKEKEEVATKKAADREAEKKRKKDERSAKKDQDVALAQARGRALLARTDKEREDQLAAALGNRHLIPCINTMQEKVQEMRMQVLLRFLWLI